MCNIFRFIIPNSIGIFVWILPRKYLTLNKKKIEVVIGEKYDIFFTLISNCVLVKSHYELITYCIWTYVFKLL